MAMDAPDMPNRILREGILTSRRMAKLSWASEVFYRRLHSIVDDFGRYHGHPMLLRAACYPLQLDKVSDSDIGKWMLETAEAGLVRVFEHADQRYIELLDFRQQVRATKSKFPEPPADATQMRSTCTADDQPPLTKTYPKSKTDSETEAGDKAAARAAPWPAPEGVQPKTWEAYLVLRKKKNAPITEHAYGLLCKTLADSPAPDGAVAKAVMNGWTGIYADKERGNNGDARSIARRKAVDDWVPPELRGQDAKQ